MTNANLMKAAYMAKGYTQDKVAEIIGVTTPTFNAKLNNRQEFKASEIKKIINLLEIKTLEEVNKIFFD